MRDEEKDEPKPWKSKVSRSMPQMKQWFLICSSTLSFLLLISADIIQKRLQSSIVNLARNQKHTLSC